MVVRHSAAGKYVNTEAKESMALEAATRQPLKIQQTQKVQCTLQ
jgi:hypothetical protein